jgi:MOSC domain-containing protein YiiM
MAEGTVWSINVSDGGVPKLPRASVGVRRGGLEGDRQRDLRHHGGRDRAVVLYSIDLIRLLQAEGHPIAPGSVGENLTLAGVDWTTLKPGVRLEIRDVRLEITKAADPCPKIASSFLEGEFSRVSAKVHPGWSRLCARVVSEGTIAVGDRVAYLTAP